MVIRRLDLEEHINTREIYEEVFFEDSKEFVDYYYAKVADHNIIYVVEEGKEILAMLHLNPYPLYMKESKQRNIYYIVAVATRSAHRKKGYMRLLLRQAMTDIYKEEHGIVYLMASAEAIYTPHDFVTVQRKNMSCADLHLTAVSGAFDIAFKTLKQLNNIEEIVYGLNERLKKSFDIFVPRTAEYLQVMERECACDEGQLYIVEHEGEPLSVLRWFPKESEEEMPFMVRIVNLRSFLQNISVKEPVHMYLKIRDPLIAENNRWFTIGAPESMEKQVELSLSTFTQFVFSLLSVEEIRDVYGEKLEQDIQKELKKFKCYRSVHFDEVV